MSKYKQPRRIPPPTDKEKEEASERAKDKPGMPDENNDENRPPETPTGY